MGLIDKFLDAIKLNDDFDDDDEFLDDDDFDDEDDYEENKSKRRFFKKFSDDDDFDDYDDIKPANKSAATSSAKDQKNAFKARNTAPVSAPKQQKSSKITPMRKKGVSNMEVNVIRPTSMEDTREIADTLLDSCTVVLNLEGLDVDVAQRIIDFTCGVCYSLNGSLQKISSYIFILTPADVDVSGDFQEILNGAFNIPSMRSDF